MTTLTAYRNPNSLFSDPFFNRLFNSAPSQGSNTRSTSPRLDAIETEESYLLNVDLPGITEEELDLSVHEGILAITGERPQSELPEGQSYRIHERSIKNFERSFRLPKDVNHEGIQASLKHGVLSIVIPKQEQAKPRKIELK